jgi:hypothetical protein
MHRTGDRVVFGHMHEDAAVEQALAAGAPMPSALVVASGGDVALTLLAGGMQVHAVDPNPAQIRLLRLKVAAAKRGAERAARWMTGAAGEAIAMLEGDEAHWWRSRRRQLTRGLCFCGTVDRRLRRLGPLLRWLYDWPSRSPGALRRTLASLGTGLLPFLAATLHGRAAVGRLDRATLQLLVQRFHRALRDAGDNPLTNALLGLGFGDHVPWVWSGAGIQAWSARSDGLTLSATSLQAVLTRQGRTSLGLVSVSNVPDLLDAQAARELLDVAATALAPGGILVVRSMLRERLEWQHARVQQLPAVADRSPLCPAVFLGRAAR